MTTLIASSRSQPGPLTRWAPLAVLMIGTFVFVLDFFIVNVALPDIQHGLRASAAAVEWVVAGYALTTAAAALASRSPSAGPSAGRARSGTTTSSARSIETTSSNTVRRSAGRSFVR